MLNSNLGLSHRANPATKPTPWVILDATGTTYDTALDTIADSATAPTKDLGNGIFVITPEKPVLHIMPLVGDADNEVGSFGVYGVRAINTASNSLTNYYTHSTLWTGTATAGAKAVGGLTSVYYADTIATTAAALPSSAYRTISTTDDCAILEIDVRDFEYIVIVGTNSGGTAASMNFAYSSIPL